MSNAYKFIFIEFNYSSHSKFEILTTKVYEILKYIYLHKATRDKESLQPATHSIMRKNWYYLLQSIAFAAKPSFLSLHYISSTRSYLCKPLHLSSFSKKRQQTMESSSSTTDVIDQMSKLDLSPIEKFAHQKGV